MGRHRFLALERARVDRYRRPAVPASVGAGAAEPEARFALAVAEHEGALVLLATRLARDPADAKDLVQDTFERALRAWDRLPADANVRAWLVTILHRLFIDRCRRAKRGAVVPLDQEHPGVEAPPPPAWADVTSEQLGRAVAQLDDEFRRVYELHAVDGKSYKEIADALGIPGSTVGTRLLRARRRLKELLVAELARAAADAAAAVASAPTEEAP
jgi:RNA polymerase sigma-70 factor (ECF subfamily)